MSKNKKILVNLTQHIGNNVFKKKNETISLSETLTLEEELIRKHREVLKIKVQSVALPPNYNLAPKTEAEIIDWLCNRVKSNWSYAYSMGHRYREKFTLKLEQKETYNNN
jgi:hypothetical protein